MTKFTRTRMPEKPKPEIEKITPSISPDDYQEQSIYGTNIRNLKVSPWDIRKMIKINVPPLTPEQDIKIHQAIAYKMLKRFGWREWMGSYGVPNPNERIL